MSLKVIFLILGITCKHNIEASSLIYPENRSYENEGPNIFQFPFQKFPWLKNEPIKINPFKDPLDKATILSDKNASQVSSKSRFSGTTRQSTSDSFNCKFLSH